MTNQKSGIIIIHRNTGKLARVSGEDDMRHHTVLTILATSALALVAQPTLAQDVEETTTEAPAAEVASLDIGAAVEVLHSTEGNTVITPSYNWRLGDCGGFGFADVFPDGGPLDFLTDNTVDCKVAGPVFASVEAGATNFGTTFKAGIGANVPVPGMQFVTITAYPFVTRGDGNRRQLKVVWRSEDFELANNVSIYASGFARFRDGAPDVVQPQVWVRVNDSPVEFGGEIAFFGSDATVLVAIKRAL